MYFEFVDNILIEFIVDEFLKEWDFGILVRFCVIMVLYGNDDYVIVRFYCFGDIKLFWEYKFMLGLNG